MASAVRVNVRCRTSTRAAWRMSRASASMRSFSGRGPDEVPRSLHARGPRRPGSRSARAAQLAFREPPGASASPCRPPRCRSKAIPRRTVLRGLGATLALPLLDGMVPALSAVRNTPARASGGRRGRGGSARSSAGPQSVGASPEEPATTCGGLPAACAARSVLQLEQDRPRRAVIALHSWDRHRRRFGTVRTHAVARRMHCRGHTSSAGPELLTSAIRTSQSGSRGCRCRARR